MKILHWQLNNLKKKTLFNSLGISIRNTKFDKKNIK